jgi:hypothetical protein
VQASNRGKCLAALLLLHDPEISSHFFLVVKHLHRCPLADFSGFNRQHADSGGVNLACNSSPNLPSSLISGAYSSQILALLEYFVKIH